MRSKFVGAKLECPDPAKLKCHLPAFGSRGNLQIGTGSDERTRTAAHRGAVEGHRTTDDGCISRTGAGALSVRQVQRLLKTFRTDGAACLRHKARGQSLNKRINDGVRDTPRRSRRAREGAATKGRRRPTSGNRSATPCTTPCFSFFCRADNDLPPTAIACAARKAYPVL